MGTLSNESQKQSNTDETPVGAEPELDLHKQVMIAYTNYKGVAGVRRIIPLKIYFGSNQWHTDPQWILVAYDLDKEADRQFAMADIHSWQ